MTFKVGDKIRVVFDLTWGYENPKEHIATVIGMDFSWDLRGSGKENPMDLLIQFEDGTEITLWPNEYDDDMLVEE